MIESWGGVFNHSPHHPVKLYSLRPWVIYQGAGMQSPDMHNPIFGTEIPPESGPILSPICSYTLRRLNASCLISWVTGYLHGWYI